MVRCEKCNIAFRGNWELVRHKNRKTPCIPTTRQAFEGVDADCDADMDAPIVPTTTTKTEKCTTKTAKCTTTVRHHTSPPLCHPAEDGNAKRCMFCLRTFGRKWDCDKHVKICPLKDDEIRKMELKTDTQFVPPPPNTCRFCKECFSRSTCLSRHLETCRERKIYKEQLEMKYQTVQNITNNTTNNDNSINNINNITNNITINAIGKESLDHINVQKVIEMISRNKRRIKDEHKTVYLVSGDMVVDFHKMIREVPENRNLVVKHEKRQTALIKRDDGDFEKEEIDAALLESFKNTSTHLYNTMSDIESNQTAPFKRDTKEIHNRVHDLTRHGFTVGRWKDDDTVKRKFKMANLDSDEHLIPL